MLKNYARLDFGESYFKGRPVIDLILEKLPVSISLGLWTTLLVYLISIPLGVAKAVRDGSRFDLWSSAAIVVGYAIPSFLRSEEHTSELKSLLRTSSAVFCLKKKKNALTQSSSSSHK